MRLTESTERYSLAKFFVIHACKIVAGINVFCAAEEEFFKGHKRLRTHWISDASEGDFGKKLRPTAKRYEFKVRGKCPSPIGDKVILRKPGVRVTAGDHFGEIPMHNTQPT